MFGLTWVANVGSASLVYWLARRYGRDFFKGPTGRRLLTPAVLAHIEAQYERHGSYGIFVSRLLPVWRAVVPPFAGGPLNGLDALLATAQLPGGVPVACVGIDNAKNAALLAVRILRA